VGSVAKSNLAADAIAARARDRLPNPTLGGRIAIPTAWAVAAGGGYRRRPTARIIPPPDDGRHSLDDHRDMHGMPTAAALAPVRHARAPRRLLAPVTLAGDFIEAVAVAATLAEAVGADLVLAGIAPVVVDPVPGATDEIDMPALQAAEQALVDRIVAERLADVADALPPAIRVRTIPMWGPVGTALVAATREQSADLLVIPIRRGSDHAHLFRDHADRYVLHHSDVPVLVVPTGGRGHRPPAPEPTTRRRGA
jgi:nucleotide-binding universal stress UspA family protein